MGERIRLTISVTQEVYDVFTAMAHTSGRSLGRCMGDWLEDTSEGAQLTVQEMERVRGSPSAALAAFLRAAAENRSLDAFVDQHEGVGQVGAQRRPGGPHRVGAPSSNTGLKSPAVRTQKGQKP